jgi:hypothetical protein
VLKLHLCIGLVDSALNSMEMVREKLLHVSGSTKESYGNGLVYIYTYMSSDWVYQHLKPDK